MIGVDVNVLVRYAVKASVGCVPRTVSKRRVCVPRTVRIVYKKGLKT